MDCYFKDPSLCIQNQADWEQNITRRQEEDEDPTWWMRDEVTLTYCPGPIGRVIRTTMYFVVIRVIFSEVPLDATVPHPSDVQA